MELAVISTAIDEFDPAPTATPRVANPLRPFFFVVLFGATAVLPVALDTPSGTPRSGYAFAAAMVLEEEDGVVPADRFASLRGRWDHPDAIPVSEQTIAKAMLLLDNLPVKVAQPHISPSSDGEIGLSWIEGADRFEAMLDPDDHLVWVTKIDGKFSVGMDVNVLASIERDAFYAALEKFYGRA